MKQISLSKNGKNAGSFFALVDDEDFERVNKYNWCILKNKNKLYAKTIINGLTITLHHFIFSPTLEQPIIDHIDGNGLNCKKINLRSATFSENMKNRKPKMGKEFLGIKWHTSTVKYFSKKTGELKIKMYSKWWAQITTNGKSISLGKYSNAEDAAKAYDEAAKKYHGKFANLNFKPNK